MVRPSAAGTSTRSSHCRVARVAAAQRVVEHALELGVTGPRTPVADRVVVDLAHRHELGRRAGDEDLVGQVQLGPRDVALDHLVAEVAGDLDALSCG